MHPVVFSCLVWLISLSARKLEWIKAFLVCSCVSPVCLSPDVTCWVTMSSPLLLATLTLKTVEPERKPKQAVFVLPSSSDHPSRMSLTPWMWHVLCPWRQGLWEMTELLFAMGTINLNTRQDFVLWCCLEVEQVGISPLDWIQVGFRILFSNMPGRPGCLNSDAASSRLGKHADGPGHVLFTLTSWTDHYTLEPAYRLTACGSITFALSYLVPPSVILKKD